MMLRHFFAALLTVFFSFAAHADGLADADKQSFQTIISGQLEAFKADQGDLAYSFAAPYVQKVFPTVEIFMGMVKRGYEPIYRNTDYKFGIVGVDGLGRPAQHVTVTASTGKHYDAVYSMEQQKDGTWKIAGCTLLEIPGVGV
jgi:Domain of unknown function (DUF4864)